MSQVHSKLKDCVLHYDPRRVVNSDARTEKVFAAVQQALRDRAAPAVVSLLDRRPALWLRIRLIRSKNCDPFGVRKVEANTQSRIRFLCDEIELDTHIVLAAKHTVRLSVRGKNTHGRQFNVGAAGSRIQIPNPFAIGEPSLREVLGDDRAGRALARDPTGF